MYKVFVNEKPLYLTNQLEKEENFKYYLLETVNLRKVLAELFLNKIESAYFYHPDRSYLMKTLKSKIPVVKAGGGVVFNKKGEILFIYRTGKWDLPKGGIEKDENIEQTAIREVEEETGVTGLKIIEKLQKTYHIFKRNGRYKLKITYWFKMETNFEGETVPQEKEDIEKAEFLSLENAKTAFLTSYQNIQLLGRELGIID